MNLMFSKPRRVAVMLLAAGALLASPPSYGAEEREPAISLTTAAYEKAQEYNLFTFCLDSDDVMYLEVDCGFGPVEYEIEPSSDGTWIPCTVTEEGVVKMYTDTPELLSYMLCNGGDILEIDLSKLVNLEILDLADNRLRRIDLSNNKLLKYIDLGTNSFDLEPLYIGEKPYLTLLEMENLGAVSPDFNLSDYPELVSFSAFSNPSLTKIDPTGCPNLMRLSLSVTGISSIDVSKNVNLRILDVSDTPVTSVDLSNNTLLEQLYVGHQGSFGCQYQIKELDVTHNPNLVYLFASSNALQNIDLSNNPKLSDLRLKGNYLTSFDYSNNPGLYSVDISQNCLDFATLPLNPNFPMGYYYQQRDIEVDRSYPVGAVIDLSSHVLRDGTTTSMALFSVSETDILSPVELGQDYYEYDNGVVKLKKECTDSVYLRFTNAAFPECILSTSKFMVKTEAEYGKPTATANFMPKAMQGEPLSFAIGIGGASEDNPRTAYIDFGDGVKMPVTVTCQMPEEDNVKITRPGGGLVVIYVEDNAPLTALSLIDQPLYSIDISKAHELRSLELVGSELYYIDLSWQRCLQRLRMTGNKFSSVNLETTIPGYDKNVLSFVDLSNNGLSDLRYNAYTPLRYLDVSHNSLSSLNIENASSLETLDISDNEFTTLSVRTLDSLKSLNVASNKLSYIETPTYDAIENLDCRNNCFHFGNLPYLPDGLGGEYLYAPQRPVEIGVRGPSANLTSIDAVVDGYPTQYAWYKEDGAVLIDGEDYQMKDGIAYFMNYGVGSVHCEMTNGAYPDFTGSNCLTTTNMLVDTPPTNLIGTLDVANTVVPDNCTINLIGLRPSDSVFINWDGEGKVFTEYVLSDTYRIYDIHPVAGKRAGIYTYNDEDNLSGFNLSNVPLKSADFFEMRSLKLLDVSNAGCKDIRLPDTDGLESLSLEGNGITTLDASRLGNLHSLNLSYNKLRSFDLSVFPNLEVAGLGMNELDGIKIDNPNLWHLDLAGNKFETFSFANLPALHQVSLASNLLTSIDINGPELLRLLRLDGNKLNFQTLPVPQETLTSYSYGNQASLAASCDNMTVDLSSQYDVHGYLTEYYWCVDEPYFDSSEGTLTGMFLEEGTDFVVVDGVTTFKHEVANVCCVMLNELFPSTYLLTELMTISTGGIDQPVVGSAAISVVDRTVTLNAQEGISYGVFSIDGREIEVGFMSDNAIAVELPAAGVYVVKVGNASMKVAVK